MSEPVVPFGDLRLEYRRNRAAVDGAVAGVLESGRFVLGDAGRRFEEEFAGYCGVSFGVGVGSGTEALHLALLACGVKPGDEVITAANTCVPTLSAVSAAGAVPVLVDADPATYTIDPRRIEERITPRTRVILPVHLYGQCADMDPVRDIARRHGLKVVEDCAQAHGAKYRGRMAGAMGDAGCYSFYPTKNLGACGDAGMVVTGDRDVAEFVRRARNYGRRTRDRHVVKGFNSRMDELQAAILRARLPGLDESNARRRRIASRYTEAFRDAPSLVCPAEGAGRHHVYHLYVIQVADRDRFREHLTGMGIETLVHYPVPIHRQDSYAECRKQERYLPCADRIAGRVVSLPAFPGMTDAQVEHVVASVRRWPGATHWAVPGSAD